MTTTALPVGMWLVFLHPLHFGSACRICDQALVGCMPGIQQHLVCTHAMQL